MSVRSFQKIVDDATARRANAPTPEPSQKHVAACQTLRNLGYRYDYPSKAWRYNFKGVLNG